MLEKMIEYIPDMGTSSLLPITVIVLCLCLGIKIGKAIRSGLMIGAGFAGIELIVDMMNSQLGTAAIAIPIAVFINILMIICKSTRTVNLDLWNIWHMIFTGAVAYAVTGKLWIGILGISVHAVIVYKLGDLLAPFIEGYFELTGLTVPHGTSAYMAPIACLVDMVIDKIPILNKIDFSIEKLQEKAGCLQNRL